MRSPPDDDRLHEIDGLRAVAVLAVLAFHTLVGAWPVGGAPGIVWCGARGVDLFFAISGFCLSYPVLRARRSGARPSIEYGPFLARRLSRIGPPYYAAIVLFVLLAPTAFGLPTAPDVAVVAPVELLRTAGLDALFLTGRSPSLNASFWTVGVEMRWYLLFPLAMWVYLRSRRAFAGLVLACYALYWFTPLSVADLGTFPNFALGIVAADLVLARRAGGVGSAAAAVIMTALAVVAQTHGIDGGHANPLWHLSAFLLVVAAGSPPFRPLLRSGPLRAVGVASYAIYLVHQPVLDRLEAAGVIPLACAASALAAGFAFYLLVERPLTRPALRASVQRALGDVVRSFRRRLAAVTTTSN